MTATTRTTDDRLSDVELTIARLSATVRRDRAHVSIDELLDAIETVNRAIEVAALIDADLLDLAGEDPLGENYNRLAFVAELDDTDTALQTLARWLLEHLGGTPCGKLPSTMDELRIAVN